MLSIRLARSGKRAQPSFRVIVQEKQRSPYSKNLEVLGSYMPSLREKPLSLKKERIEHWISMGARPSDTMAVLLKKEGFNAMDKFIEPRNKKRKKKGEEAAAVPPPAKEEAP